MATLTLDAVNKVYRPRGKEPVHAVRDVNMATDDGEIIGLLGSSGCGKTSTLRMIAGFESVSEGAIRLGDRTVNDLAPARRNVAMAFEGYALYPPLTVRDNIGFSLLRQRRSRAEVDQKVKAVADLLEIGPILDRYPPNLSGGQQQRVSLARALVRDADLHLLDEPMSQLEPQLRAILRARIKEHLIEERKTTVFVTHDQTEAIALADRIAVMEGGVLQQYGTPAEMKERPANLFVASFIGEPPMNLFAGRIARREGGFAVQVRAEDGGDAFVLPLEVGANAGFTDGKEVQIGIRPHKAAVGTAADATGPAAGEMGGGLVGRVTSNQSLGDQSHLGVDLNGVFLIVVTDGVVSTPVDSSAPVVLPAESLHVFDAETGRALTHGREAVRAAS